MQNNTQYQLPPLPHDAPFEIRPSAGKGRGAFATRDIEAPACVLREEPLFVIWKPDFEIGPSDVESAFLRLGGVEKQRFITVGWSENRSFVSRFETFMRNKFQIVEAGHDHAPDVVADGQGMFLLCSRFNHSCVPNAAVVESSSSRSNYAQAIYAIKPIARGEEITINYDPNFNYLTTEIRRSAGTWDFVCNCRACDVTDPFHYVSDMRRALLRGLYYLLSGVDAPGCEGRKSPLTREAEKEKTFLKDWHLVKSGSKEAEKVMTWSVLAGYVSEAEGLADLASEHFRNAVIAIGRLCGEDPEAEKRKIYGSNACLWALKSRDAIKSCRPADHFDVTDREQLLTRALRLPLS